VELVDWASFQFWIERVPAGSSQSIRVSLEHVEATLGVKPKELENEPEFPECLRYVWDWYLGLFSGERLTYTELQNWSAVTKTPIAGWEAELLMSLDRARWKTSKEPAQGQAVSHV
jgi:hypothetical protein